MKVGYILENSQCAACMYLYIWCIHVFDANSHLMPKFNQEPACCCHVVKWC